MGCICAQTRPQSILSSERVLGEWTMLTPRDKSPRPEKIFSPEEYRTHDASSRTASPTLYQRAFPAPICVPPDNIGTDCRATLVMLVRTHANSKGNIPSTGKNSPQRSIEPTTHPAGQRAQQPTNELFRPRTVFHLTNIGTDWRTTVGRVPIDMTARRWGFSNFTMSS